MEKRATSLTDAQAILLDLGGTLRIGGESITGATEFLESLKKSNTPFFALTNATSKSTESLVEVLNNAGLPLQADHMITANLVTIDYMKKKGIKSAYVIGEEEQKKEFEQHGIIVSDQKASAVVVSFDYDLNYEKLAIADYLIRNGATYIATNIDTHFIAEDGIGPDTGGTIGFLKATTGKDPVITGKPGQIMMKYVMEKTGIKSTQMAMVGDALDVDMKMAHEFGMVSVMVLSGKTKRDDLACSAYQPDYVVESVENLTPLFS
ncbi:MAG: HAD-IIA family hydrolase [Candidatus Kerfeldbacteria bacterium]